MPSKTIFFYCDIFHLSIIPLFPFPQGIIPMIPYVPLVPTQSFIDLLANAFTYFYLPKSVTPHKSFLIYPSLFVCTTYFVVFASNFFRSFLFSLFSVRSLLLIPITLISTLKYFATNFPVWYHKQTKLEKSQITCY